eukprot:1160495-Pelagomonas_calceolata.AAC.3
MHMAHGCYALKVCLCCRFHTQQWALVVCLMQLWATHNSGPWHSVLLSHAQQWVTRNIGSWPFAAAPHRACPAPSQSALLAAERLKACEDASNNCDDGELLGTSSKRMGDPPLQQCTCWGVQTGMEDD